MALPIIRELYSKFMGGWGKLYTEGSNYTAVMCASLLCVLYVSVPHSITCHRLDQKVPRPTSCPLINTKRIPTAGRLKDVHQCGIPRPSLKGPSLLMSCLRSKGVTKTLPKNSQWPHPKQEATTLTCSLPREALAFKVWSHNIVRALNATELFP